MLQDQWAKVLACARGSYQRDLLTGAARWSGGDLRGKASKYGTVYAKSRSNLLRRLRAAGIDATTDIVFDEHRRRYMRVLLIDGKRWV